MGHLTSWAVNASKKKGTTRTVTNLTRIERARKRQMKEWRMGEWANGFIRHSPIRHSLIRSFIAQTAASRKKTIIISLWPF
ncbi:MAG: hypothetical protein DPW09_20075 [Anaerolineae bacterium]|nr:hypothetical protein [Anaerolineae bacterium]